MDKLSALKTFCRVVETHSFSKAAQTLSLSKAVVSKYITELEKQLAVTLVNRNTRGVQITEAGLAYYKRVGALLEGLSAAEDEIRNQAQTPSGSIRLSVPVSMGLMFITPLLPQFLSQYPDITIEVILDDGYVDVLNDRFDLVIRGTAKLMDSSIKSRKIGQFRHVICCSPAYLQQKGRPQLPEDLAQHSVLVYTGIAQPDRWQFTHPASKQESIVQVAGSYRANNSLALKQAALQDGGLLRIPDIYIQAELNRGELMTVLDEYQTPPLDIWILYSINHVLPNRVRVLIDYLVENFNP